MAERSIEDQLRQEYFCRMKERTLEVYRALQAFEEEFENLIRSDPLRVRKDEEPAP